MRSPIGRNKALFGNVSSWADYFVGGWSLNTITTWASGLPFSPSYNPQECLQDRDTGPCRPNLVGVIEITGDRNNYFTTASKPLSKAGVVSGPWERPAVGTFGNAAINSLRGPSYFNTDLSVFKEVSVQERYTVQFRTDFLNVFNRVNLANPGSCVGLYFERNIFWRGYYNIGAKRVAAPNSTGAAIAILTASIKRIRRGSSARYALRG